MLFNKEDSSSKNLDDIKEEKAFILSSLLYLIPSETSIGLFLG